MAQQIIPQKLVSLKILKLKGLKDVTITFDDKNVTGIFGVNGSGKSTILHVIDCMYRNLNSGYASNRFTKYFKRVGNSKWLGSEFTANFIINSQQKSIRYYKSNDRWMPRIKQQPQRDCVFLGIDSCVPCIERETPTHTNYHMVSDGAIAHVNDIVRDASNIMGKQYATVETLSCAGRKYKKVQIGIENYTSLSMGAGEQKMFSILETIYSIPNYSVLLIDELDLTMHTIALNRLVDKIVSIANTKNLQVIFTSHREELALRNDINIRHLWKPANQDVSLCLEQTTPDCLYRLNGTLEHDNVIYVEHKFAESIVRDCIRQMNMQKYVKVIQFGDAANAFSLATGLYLQGTLSKHHLILTDGDCFRSDKDRTSIMKKRFSGSEVDKIQKRQDVLAYIKQFNLPENEHPEHFVWTILRTKNGPLAEIANTIDQNQSDNHSFLYEIQQIQADTYEAFMIELLNEVREDSQWASYVQEITKWLSERKLELGV